MNRPALVLNGSGVKRQVSFKDNAAHKIIVIGTNKAQVVTVNDDTRVTFAA